MERVAGIGGLFIKAENPQQLARWYEDNLGVSRVPTSYGEEPWMQEAGPTAFAAFEKSSEFFGRGSQQWMLNFRVHNLQAMVAQLRAAGIEVTVDETEYPNGWFASLCDPEGNPIQLWQPESPAATKE